MGPSFNAEGSSDFSRLIILRDDSLSSDGIPEADELGAFEGALVGVVETVDDDGIVQKTRQGFLQPRNWHELEKPNPITSFKLVDRRFDVALIADHQNEPSGWKIEDRSERPLLDDWYGDKQSINSSTRIGDMRDPKSRTAMLNQLVIVKDDHLQQYTAALNLGPEVGNHEKAAGGYVYDNDRDFMGQLATFFTTNHQDEILKGREGTPIGYLGMRHDAHVEFPGVDHGRFHIVRENCDDYEEMPKKFGGGGTTGASDRGKKGEEPQTHFYKSRLMYDHKVKGQDTELVKESAQLRPVYHCVDAPERGNTTIINNIRQIVNVEEITNIHQEITNNTTIITIIVINQGGGGGGTQIVQVYNPNKPEEPPVTTETPIPPPPGGGREPPPGGSQGGRVICVPLSHNPPLLDGLGHTTHGYFAVSEDGNGGQKGWIGGWHDVPFGPAPGSQVGTPESTPFGPAPGALLGEGARALEAGWQELVSAPRVAPAGLVPTTDGKGGASWSEIPPPPAPVVKQEPSTSILFDVLGYDPGNSNPFVEDGYVWVPDPVDPRKLRLQHRVGGTVAETALLIDGTGTKPVSAFGDLLVRKAADVANGLVPVSSAGGIAWSSPLSVTVGPGIFGDGSDGAANFSGGAVAGCSFDGALTYTQTRDVYYSSIDFDPTFRLVTNGWRTFCSGTCNIGVSNRLNNDGKPAVTATQGAGITAQTVGDSGAGATGVSRGTSGGSNGVLAVAVGNSFGGTGGTGGTAGIGFTGGGGGTATAPASKYGELRQVPQITEATLFSFQGSIGLLGGGGGGSGGVDYDVSGAGTITSGGGGGGGGVLMLAAAKLVNLGIIACDGGPGGAGVIVSGYQGAGGGGGGGGGLAIVVYGASGSTLGTVHANGGLGGAGATVGGDTGNNGSPGSAGRVRTLAI